MEWANGTPTAGPRSTGRRGATARRSRRLPSPPSPKRTRFSTLVWTEQVACLCRRGSPGTNSARRVASRLAGGTGPLSAEGRLGRWSRAQRRSAPLGAIAGIMRHCPLWARRSLSRSLRRRIRRHGARGRFDDSGSQERGQRRGSPAETSLVLGRPG